MKNPIGYPFEDNICEREDHISRTVKLSVTVSDLNNERLKVLAHFMKKKYKSASSVMELALNDFFEKESSQEALQEGYDKWKKSEQ